MQRSVAFFFLFISSLSFAVPGVDSVGSLCVTAVDHQGMGTTYLEGQKYFVSIGSEYRQKNPKSCISGRQQLPKLKLEKQTSTSWEITGNFVKGNPPYTPDCGGGVRTFELGKLVAGEYKVKSNHLELKFRVVKKEDRKMAKQGTCIP